MLCPLGLLARFLLAWLSCPDHPDVHVCTSVDQDLLTWAVVAAGAIALLVARDVQRTRSPVTAARIAVVYHSLACVVLAAGAAQAALAEPGDVDVAIESFVLAALIIYGCVLAAWSRGILRQPLRPPPPIPVARVRGPG